MQKLHGEYLCQAILGSRNLSFLPWTVYMQTIRDKLFACSLRPIVLDRPTHYQILDRLLLQIFSGGRGVDLFQLIGIKQRNRQMPFENNYFERDTANLTSFSSLFFPLRLLVIF